MSECWYPQDTNTCGQDDALEDGESTHFTVFVPDDQSWFVQMDKALGDIELKLDEIEVKKI